MDNDSLKVQQLKNVLRTAYHKVQYMDKRILTVKDGSDWIKAKLQTNEPFMVCRVGATEGRAIRHWMKNEPFSEQDVQNIKALSGVFPNDQKSLERFCQVYADSARQADGILTWGCIGESHIVRRCAPKNVTLMHNDTFNVLFYDEPWTYALKGKRVLIVHPFVNTIKEQYKCRKQLFKTEILPEFSELVLVRAIQSSAGESESLDYSSWFDALEAMKEEIYTKDFDVALIGAGAYGIPLAAYIKSMGKQAIHMAGNLQILFGIRGKRWDNFPQYVQYFNKFWVYPDDSETPKQKESVEGGSYWR